MMKAFIFILLMSVASSVLSQNLPIGLMPMHYNSSFAGSVGKSRISSSIDYRSQKEGDWYRSHQLGIYASYDKYFPGIRSGIGITVSRNSSSSEMFDYNAEYIFNSNYTNISFDVAPKISIKGKCTLSPSLRISYYGGEIEFDIPDPDRYPRIEEGYREGISTRVGLLFNTDRYFIGYSVHLFSSEFEGIDFGSFSSTLQAGYTFQRDAESKFSFTPQVVIGLRSPTEFGNNVLTFPSLNLGFRYGQFLGSLLSMNSDYIPSFQLGWQNNGWRIITSHEFDMIYKPTLSVRYIFNHGKKSKHIYSSNF